MWNIMFNIKHAHYVSFLHYVSIIKIIFFMFRSNRKNNRYFFQTNNSLCNNFTPGKLSGALLEALGVSENGIPVHIYKMRENGYPRAWIEEAREEYSGISIFTAPNKCNYKSIFDFMLLFLSFYYFKIQLFKLNL